MTPDPFVFGKVPSRGDFVRAGRRTPLLDELDGWLQRGLVQHRAPMPVDAPPVAFVFDRAGEVLLGTFVPSRDRAGRQFPLVAGAAAGVGSPVEGRDLAHWGPVLAASAAVADEVSLDALMPEEALDRLDGPPPPGGADFLDRLPAEAFGDAGVVGAVQALPEALRPFRMPGAAPRYGLGLPLPSSPDLRPAAAAFWLAAVRRASGARPATTLLWTAGGPRARLAVFLGPPTPDALGYVMAGQAAEGVYDLDAAAPAGPPPSGAPTLRALLDRL